jgi:hypothetical protein
MASESCLFLPGLVVSYLEPLLRSSSPNLAEPYGKKIRTHPLPESAGKYERAHSAPDEEPAPVCVDAVRLPRGLGQR